MSVRSSVCQFLILVSPVLASPPNIDPPLAQACRQTTNQQAVSVLLFLSNQVNAQQSALHMRANGMSMSARHHRLVNQLQQHARLEQAPLVHWLTTLKQSGSVISFQPLWLVNAVRVQVPIAHVNMIAAHQDVYWAFLDHEIALVQPQVREECDYGGNGVIEPGLEAIRVPDVWNLGIDGSGTLVANIDTGVDGRHPALANRWAGAVDSRYSDNPQWAWYDPFLGLNGFPYDDGHHGTHTMGTICGGAPGDAIGVAPGATWIAAAAIDRSSNVQRTVSDAILAFQWIVDPDGNPATHWDVPDVCANSWGLVRTHGYPDCDDLFWSFIDACEAMGVVVLFAAGNEGFFGLRRPADRAVDEYRNTAVAAVDARDAGWSIASFSSRGPTYCHPDGLAIKPDVAAPGIAVRSAWAGTTDYYCSDGTSMATPHVAGVVALMRQACPDLEVDLIKEILFSTAQDLGSSGKDNDYGWGLVDAFEAVLAARRACGQATARHKN